MRSVTPCTPPAAGAAGVSASVFTMKTLTENARVEVPDSPSSRCFKDPRRLPPRGPAFLWTVVFDLDETLGAVDRTDVDNKLFTSRPYAIHFLKALHAIRAPLVPGELSRLAAAAGIDSVLRPRAVEVIIWSAGVREHVDRCLEILDPSGTLVDHAICRGNEWLPVDPVPWFPSPTTAGHRLPCGSLFIEPPAPPLGVLRGSALKDVSLLPGREASSILFDDLPLASIRSGGRVVLLPVFSPASPTTESDTTLLFVLNVIVSTTIALAVERLYRAGNAALVTPAALATTPSEPIPSDPADCHEDLTDIIESANRVLRAILPLPPAPSGPLVAIAAAATPMATLSDIDERSSVAIANRVSTVLLGMPAPVADVVVAAAPVADAVVAAAPVADAASAVALRAAVKAAYCAAVTEALTLAPFSNAPVVLSPTTSGATLSHATAKARLDASAIAKLVRGHPFLIRHTVPSVVGLLAACVLDASDSARLTTRINAHLDAVAGAEIRAHVAGIVGEAAERTHELSTLVDTTIAEMTAM